MQTYKELITDMLSSSRSKGLEAMTSLQKTAVTCAFLEAHMQIDFYTIEYQVLYNTWLNSGRLIGWLWSGDIK